MLNVVTMAIFIYKLLGMQMQIDHALPMLDYPHQDILFFLEPMQSSKKRSGHIGSIVRNKSLYTKLNIKESEYKVITQPCTLFPINGQNILR